MREQRYEKNLKTLPIWPLRATLHLIKKVGADHHDQPRAPIHTLTSKICEEDDSSQKAFHWLIIT